MRHRCKVLCAFCVPKVMPGAPVMEMLNPNSGSKFDREEFDKAFKKKE